MDFDFTNNIIANIKEKKELQKNSVILTKNEILFIHDLCIDEFGGTKEIRDNNLLNSICLSPYQSFGGQNLYPTPIDKAAKYLFDFAHYQVFVDGNKRTGLATACYYLDSNNLELNLNTEQRYQLVMDIANNKYLEPSEVADIIKENIIEKEMEIINYERV